MDTSRANLLGELALDADLERGDHIRVAAEQLIGFLDANRDRIAALGGMDLIDEDPDFLAVQADLTFRVQSRFKDTETGEWRSEIEIVDAPELVELYNPADIYGAFVDAARAAAGLGGPSDSAMDEDDEDDEDDELVPDLDSAPTGASESGELYAEAADEWAAGQPAAVEAEGEDAAAHALYDLALEYQERSQDGEARLLGAFEAAAAILAGQIGDFVIVDDDDERLTLDASGTLRAEVVPDDGDGEWRSLQTPTQLVEYYDPTDVFGDLADALAEAYPGVAPDDKRKDADEDDADEDEAEADADAEGDGDGPSGDADDEG